MTDAEVWSLIFAPGFSTADVVTDVSGRGVGMDVVKKNITALGGTVEIDSAEGYGMTRRGAPAADAGHHGRHERGRGRRGLHPAAVRRWSSRSRSSPSTIKTIGGTGRVVEVRDEYMPVLDLERVFERAALRLRARQQPIMVVVEAEGGRVALLVDELLGQQQVVVKNLEANYRKVDDVSGATILGDGRVALILDVGSPGAALAALSPVRPCISRPSLRHAA